MDHMQTTLRLLQRTQQANLVMVILLTMVIFMFGAQKVMTGRMLAILKVQQARLVHKV